MHYYTSDQTIRFLEHELKSPQSLEEVNSSCFLISRKPRGRDGLMLSHCTTAAAFLWGLYYIDIHVLLVVHKARAVKQVRHFDCSCRSSSTRSSMLTSEDGFDLTRTQIAPAEGADPAPHASDATVARRPQQLGTFANTKGPHVAQFEPGLHDLGH